MQTQGHALDDLEFASDVSAPTGDRFRRVDGDDIVAGDTTQVASTDTIGYGHIVKLKAYAKDNYIRGIRGAGNQEIFHMFVTPQQMASLKLDSDFLSNVRNAGVRGEQNSLFSGSTSLMVDGVMIHEFRHVFNTVGANTGSASEAGDPGYKWGATANVDGARALFCGAQALAMADIGNADMTEDTFDYGNQSGISVGKIFGLRKPKYHVGAGNSGNVQDFGVIALDTAQ